jgi:putative Ca2+/H+ antiporter (TMEM165/GDT1 family)
MEAFFNSFIIVFIGEMGDKTQLLTLILMARYRRPWVIFFGVLVATLLNHALATLAGAKAAAYVDETILEYSLAAIFVGFGLWVLIPDKEGEIKAPKGWGAFVTTTIAFFIAEMGDKTQLATVALGAKYSSVVIVTIATTLGMLAANAIPIVFGEKLLKKIPMNIIRIVACLLFIAFGLGILINHWNS